MNDLAWLLLIAVAVIWALHQTAKHYTLHEMPPAGESPWLFEAPEFKDGAER